MQRKREPCFHPPKSAKGGLIFRASENEAFCDTTVEFSSLDEMSSIDASLDEISSRDENSTVVSLWLQITYLRAETCTRKLDRVLLDLYVKRLRNTLFNAYVLLCGQVKKTTVCLVSVLRHRNSHTKNQKMLGAPPNHFCSRQAVPRKKKKPYNAK